MLHTIIIVTCTKQISKNLRT
ncbi:hypothetical protein Gotur_018824 [Gossypium turneri]